jgi:glycosyltransferase involved in cell wall biosynthesis
MERKVLESCDVAIANTPGIRRALLERFPGLPEGRVVVVTNGFDPEPPTAAALEPADAVDCDIVYMGEVYKGMLDLFLKAMVAMRSQAPVEIPRVNLFGTVDDGELSRISEMGFGDHVRHRGFVSVDQSERIIREAPSLLLLLPHENAFTTCVPSKLYPYLAARRPILALVPRGDAATIVSEAGSGVAVTDTDPDSVAAEILEFVRGVRAGTAAVGNDAYISRFSVAKLAARVEEALKR